MAAIRSGFSALMAPGLRKVIFEAYDETTQRHQRLFNIETSGRQYEDDQQITGFGLIPEKTEGSAVDFEDPLQSFSKRYTHTTYGLGITITMEMYQDDQYRIARRWANALGRSARATVETITSNVFNNGFSTSYPAPDGAALFSTSHVLKGGGTSSNRPATDADLSPSALESAIQAFKAIRDDQNIMSEVQPRILLVSTSDYFTALKIVGSPQEAFTANNQINPIKSQGLTVIDWPYLTDADAWFLLGAPKDTMLNVFWRMRPAMSNDDDFTTGNALYKILFRMSCGASDWRGLYGTSGG